VPLTVVSRSDVNTNLNETFTYDTLNRLTSSTVNLSPTPLSKARDYADAGSAYSPRNGPFQSVDQHVSVQQCKWNDYDQSGERALSRVEFG
jgi:hypothetical protein